MTDAEREAELRCGPVSGLPRGGDVAFVIRLLDEARAQSGWRAIESAPKNESVLIYIPNAEHYGHGVYRGMLVDMGAGQHWSANAVAMGRDLGRDTMPTHWMPLPAPPAE